MNIKHKPKPTSPEVVAFKLGNLYTPGSVVSRRVIDYGIYLACYSGVGQVKLFEVTSGAVWSKKATDRPDDLLVPWTDVTNRWTLTEND